MRKAAGYRVLMRYVTRTGLGALVLGAVWLGSSSPADADVLNIPRFIVYQGRLTQPDGTPVAANAYSLRFGIYADSSATTHVCDSAHVGVPVKGGVFRVAIGQGGYGGGSVTGSCVTTDLQNELSTRPELWMQIEVKGPSDSAYQILAPLVQLGAAPRAHYARNAGRASVASEADGALKAMLDEMRETLVPVGTVAAYAGSAAPDGWLMCNGAEVSRSTYATLFMSIGTAHGTGNGATTFHLPDYRGRFLRGVDGVSGRDPDAQARTAMGQNGNVGNAVGSVQTDGLKSHDHSLTQGIRIGSYMDPTNAGSQALVSPSAPFIRAATTGGSETRPINAYVNFIIKY